MQSNCLKVFCTDGRRSKGLKSWFATYLEWLLESEPSKEESGKLNNHGTFHDVQVASFAFTPTAKPLQKILSAVAERRIAVQVEPDGTQPLELDRTLSLGYSTANLRIAHVGTNGRTCRYRSLELFTSDQRNLKAVFNHLARTQALIKNGPINKFLSSIPSG